LVRDFLEITARRCPAKTALVCGKGRFSYAEIEAMANRLANALVKSGVCPGDRVAIYLENCVEAVGSIFATLKASAVFVVINPGIKHDKLCYILRNCRASVLIADAGSISTALEDSLCGSVPSLKTLVLCGNPPPTLRIGNLPVLGYDAVQTVSPLVCPPRHNIDRDLACLIYTSGTTGEPKGVMSDHSNVVFAAGSIINYLENVESDVVINVLPLSFDYGLYQLLMTFRFGGTLVLEKSYAFPAVLLALIEKERVTGFPGVPTIFSLLVRNDLTGFDLSSLRYLTNTAAALPTSHILEIRRKFPHARLFSMYGLTETKRTLYLPPEELDRRPGSVGIPIPGTEAWVEDDSGQRLGPGQVGELVVRGRHVMRGYWEAPEATAKRFRPGPIPGERLCYTGDLFRQDEAGFFYFVSRMDDIIKSRGEKVAPKEVENVLYELPGVLAAAIVGVDDPVLGQAVKAILVLREGTQLTAGKVIRHCRARLEDFMVPKIVEFRDSLPTTPSGKIAKRGL
jgi:amino acid adenylation domain-containing protein